MNSTASKVVRMTRRDFVKGSGAAAIKSGIDLRKVNIGAVQDILSKQGVPLPNRA